MEDSRVSSSFYVPDILSPKVLITVKTVAISVGGIILLIGDFLLLLTHSMNSKFLGNDLDYDAISYYVNFGGRQIFYCVNFILTVIFILAFCCKSKNLSIIYNCFSVIQIIGRVVWYIALVLATSARTILQINDESKKENKGFILITIVFSYEIIYYFFTFIFLKTFIKHLRRYDPKVYYGFNSSIEINNEICSNDYSYCKTFFQTGNDSLNMQNVSWLKSNDYSLRSCNIQNNVDNKQNNILSYAPLLYPEKSINLLVDTNILHLNDSMKHDCKNSDISWQSDC